MGSLNYLGDELVLIMKAVGQNVVVKYHQDDLKKTTGGILVSAGNTTSTPNDTLELEVLSIGNQAVGYFNVGDTVLAQRHSVQKIECTRKATLEDGSEDWICIVNINKIVGVLEHGNC